MAVDNYGVTKIFPDRVGGKTSFRKALILLQIIHSMDMQAYRVSKYGARHLHSLRVVQSY